MALWFAFKTELRMIGALTKAVKQYSKLHESLPGKLEFYGILNSASTECECFTKDQHEIHIVLGGQQSALSGFMIFAAQGYGFAPIVMKYIQKGYWCNIT
jgi:hypothetical protein